MVCRLSDVEALKADIEDRQRDVQRLIAATAQGGFAGYNRDYDVNPTRTAITEMDLEVQRMRQRLAQCRLVLPDIEYEEQIRSSPGHAWIYTFDVDRMPSEKDLQRNVVYHVVFLGRGSAPHQIASVPGTPFDPQRIAEDLATQGRSGEVVVLRSRHDGKNGEIIRRFPV